MATIQIEIAETDLQLLEMMSIINECTIKDIVSLFLNTELDFIKDELKALVNIHKPVVFKKQIEAKVDATGD